MEEVFNQPVENDKKQEAQKLRDQGLSYSQIGERLGFSKQYAIKILKEGGNPAVTKGVTNSDLGVTKGVTNSDLGVTKGVTNSDLGVTKGNQSTQGGVTNGGNLEVTTFSQEQINELKKTFVTSKEINIILEEFKEQIQIFLEERIQKTLNYYINNTLNTVIESKIKEVYKGN